MEMEEITKKFKKDMITRGLASQTIFTYLFRFDKFLQFMASSNRDFIKASKNDIRDYIDFLRSRKMKTQSIALSLAAISSFYDFLLFEDLIESNPVTPARKRYLQAYKADGEKETHKIISVKEASDLIRGLVDIRDKTLAALLLKTGIRRGELLAINVDDINWKDQVILLKSTKKRSNRLVYFDNEMAYLLRRWLAVRKERVGSSRNRALFISSQERRLSPTQCNIIIVEAAERLGLHNSNSDRMEDHFSPHCCRHFWTTHLLRAGMPREYVKELRGDVRKEAIDIYHHIDKEDLRKSYLAHVPQLSI
jgi:integrase/recombinase XerD